MVNLYLSKTKTGKNRRVRAAEPLGGLLIKRIEGRFGLEPLYPSETKLGRLSRFDVHRAVLRICRVAGVQRVCPQGLRGSHASLAQEAGTTSEVVGAALGHGPGVDNRSYATRDSQAAGRQARVMRLLKGSEPA